MSSILIAGGTGFVGSRLSELLAADGHHVSHLSRSARPEAEFTTYEWDVRAGLIPDEAVLGKDYIVNLAGAGIADARWTDRRKRVIIDSRTESTQLLATAMQRTGHRPKLYLSASAVGYYGNRGEEVMTEDAKPGDGFLSESCIRWEESVRAVAELGVPCFINRTGIVLSPEGGALEKMLLPMIGRVSTYFGDGQQWYSWIHMADIIGIYAHAIERNLVGTFNGTAPNPVRNKQLALAIPPAADKKALVLPAPALAMKVAMGEMAHTVLDSCRCSAAAIEGAGYRFQFPELSAALIDLLRD